MTSSSYTLDLYCDNIQTIGDDRYHLGKLFHSWDHIPDAIDTFFADGPKCYSQVRKMAKNKGWKFNKDGTHFCPKCNKK